MSIENGDNISTLIKQEYIKDYIDPTSSKCLIQLMKIYETINEYKGIKKDFVVIEQISLYCDYCYVKIEKDEDQLIKMSIENGDNISTLIKQEYIKDYIDPTSSKCLIQLMKIYETINEYKGIKKDFVVIELEKI